MCERGYQSGQARCLRGPVRLLRRCFRQNFGLEREGFSMFSFTTGLIHEPFGVTTIWDTTCPRDWSLGRNVVSGKKMYGLSFVLIFLSYRIIPRFGALRFPLFFGSDRNYLFGANCIRMPLPFDCLRCLDIRPT